MRLVALLLAVTIFGMVPANAGDVPPPFEMPDGDQQRPIPKGLGMRFFHGKWDYIRQGGFIPTTVTAKAFINDALGHAKPYRVLVEAPNYVLLATLMRPDSKMINQTPWTSFAVITLAHYEGADPYSVFANMIYHYCTHESMFGGDHAFSWPTEKLMQVFKASCLTGIDPKDRFPFGQGWSGSRYQRR